MPPLGNTCFGSTPFPYDNGNMCCSDAVEAHDLNIDPTCDGGRLDFDSKCCGGRKTKSCPVAGQCQMSSGWFKFSLFLKIVTL